MKYIVLFIFTLTVCLANAQIGYQVSLLNNATGEARANETVSVVVKITNSHGIEICKESKTAKTNDFGILSLTIGKSNTFNGVDWTRLPLYIEATVDGRSLGRTQILTVPVAEHANHANEAGVLSKSILSSKANWTHHYGKDSFKQLSFNLDGAFSFSSSYRTYSGLYEINGNLLILYYYDKDDNCNQADVYLYSPTRNSLAELYGGSEFI